MFLMGSHMYPWFLLSSLPRPDGSHIEYWGKDLSKGSDSLYFERIWRAGKLIYWKQWNIPGHQDPMYEYGFRQDGTSTRKIEGERFTLLPVPYRTGICPKSRVLFRKFTVDIFKTVHERITGD